MSKSYLQILLHAHLPFIRHPEYDDFLEERWLFEAISETYLPLLRSFARLQKEEIPFHLAMSFSPCLLAMLQDELLCERYVRHLDQMIELGEKELVRTEGDSEFAPQAAMYLELYRLNRTDFVDVYGRDLIAPYRSLARKGHLELITTPATYPFLPFYEHYPQNIWTQLETAVEYFDTVFGFRPSGMWLPEAGYFEGLEHYLKELGIKFFYTSFHGFLFSPEVPKSGVYAPGKLSNGMHVFGRDRSSASLVWSDKTGYPSDPVYRDFYRDIGYDLPLDYISPYIHLSNIRINTGFKYYRITGKGSEKKAYNIDVARAKAGEHARNFVYHHLMHMEKVQTFMTEPPISTSPYTAELFGHWWFEGPLWLEEVFRELSRQGHGLESITPSEYLSRYPEQQAIQPIFSSWGTKGYAETWLEGRSDWIYRHIHMAIDRMTELVERFPDATGLKKRALSQAAREVLLCQSLDWPVIMRNGSAESYASGRIKEHLANFYRIYDALGEGRLSTEWLTKIEKKNNLFPGIEYLRFGRRQKPRSTT